MVCPKMLPTLLAIAINSLHFANSQCVLHTNVMFAIKVFGMKASSNGRLVKFSTFACSQPLMGNHALSLSHTQTLN